MPEVQLPLRQTTELLAKYGDKLINGTISVEELRALVQGDEFKRSRGGPPNFDRLVSDDNFNQLQGMINFVQVIAPKIPRATLHELNNKMLDLSPTREENSYLREPANLTRVMLAYQLVNYPEDAKKHLKEHPKLHEVFDHKPMAGEAKNPAVYEVAIETKLKDVLLNECVKIFRAPIVPIAPTASTEPTASTAPIASGRTITKRLSPVKSYYTHAVKDEESPGRQHLFEASSTDGCAFKSQYLLAKGDYLKTKILNKFKVELEYCSSKEDLMNKVRELKETEEYGILAKGQGLFTRIFNIETSSVKAFNKMVEEVSDHFDNPGPSP